MALILSRAFRVRSLLSLPSSCARSFSTISPPTATSLRLRTPFLYNSLPAFSHGAAQMPIQHIKFGRFTVRCKVSRSGDSGYSPLNSGSPNWSDRPPQEIGPLFPGCDYEHWLIVMDPPNEGKATKEEMIDCYIKTLAKVLGSQCLDLETVRRRPRSPYITYRVNVTLDLVAKSTRRPPRSSRGCLELYLFCPIHIWIL